MRPRGVVRLFKRGELLWERDNRFVNAGLPALANLIAGVTSGQFVSAMGFGSGAAQPQATDTALGATPAYYNAIGSYSFPSAGSVEFSYSLLTTDYGANGMTIQELGLFANAAGVSLPAAQGSSSPAWTANSAISTGAMIVDANGNLQLCTTAGTTGAHPPTWATAFDGATSDGTVGWKLVAFHQAPGPLIAHVVVPAFTYTGAGNYSGTWTLTF